MRMNPDQWPFRYEHFCKTPPLPGRVSPQRHDIALARYLEKQAACRATTTHCVNVLVRGVGSRARVLALVGRVVALLAAHAKLMPRG